ncbi:hypothetical protein [Microbacterium xylanilyticum]
MSETTETLVARIDERLVAVERDIKEIKASIRPAWPMVVAAVAAVAAFAVNLVPKL